MPVGKNSIKRVKDGYSNVKTTAPDMQNSTVIANLAPEVADVMLPKAKTKKPSSKKAKPAPEKQAVPVAQPNGFVKFGLGDTLPDYLL